MEDKIKISDEEKERLQQSVALLGTIDVFLQKFVPGTPGGGWATPSQEDYNTLRNIISDLINLKFDRDCDGSMSVSCDLHVRSTGYKPWFPTFPHMYPAPDNVKERWEKLMTFGAASKMLMDVATDQHKQFHIQLDSFSRDYPDFFEVKS